MERGFLKSKETSVEKDPCTLCTANWKDSIRWGGVADMEGKYSLFCGS